MFCVKPSMATGAVGKILGGDGFRRTVRPILFVWRVFPVPASLTMQLKFPLSLLYVVFFIFRSYWPRDGKRSTLKVFFLYKNVMFGDMIGLCIIHNSSKHWLPFNNLSRILKLGSNQFFRWVNQREHFPEYILSQQYTTHNSKNTR